MPSLSPIELLVVAVVALIVFGPQRLPEIARTVGRWLNEMRRMASDVRAEFEAGLDLDVEDEPEDETPRRTPAPAPEPEPPPQTEPDPKLGGDD
jgi:sec-independent protein translocase protein TatB